MTNRIYAINNVDGTVNVIDGYTNKVIHTITVGSGHVYPEGCEDTNTCTTGAGSLFAAVNPVTNRIYVLNFFDGTVSVIDGYKNKEIAQIPIGAKGYGIAVNPITNRIYAVDSPNNALKIIDGGSNKVVATVTVGSNPLWVDVNPLTNRIYVVNNNDNTVSVLDGKNNSVIAVIPVPPSLIPAGCTTNCTSFGSAPVAVAVNPSTNRIYVTDYLNGSINVIDGETNKVIGAPYIVGSGVPQPANCFVISTCTSFGSQPFAVAVNPIFDLIYVLNLNDQTLSVLKEKERREE